MGRSQIFVAVSFFVVLSSFGAIFFLSQTSKPESQVLSAYATTPSNTLFTTGGSSYVWNEEKGTRDSGDKWLGTGIDTNGSYLVTTLVGATVPKGTKIISAILTLTSLRTQQNNAYAIIHAEFSPGTHGGQTVAQWPKTAASVTYKLVGAQWTKGQKIVINVAPIVQELATAEGINGRINFTFHGGTTANERMYIYGGDDSNASNHPSLALTLTPPTTPTLRPTLLPTVTPTTPAPTVIPATTAPASGSFIQRSGNTLMQDGKKIRLVGANIFWLGMDQHGSVTSPSQFEIDDALTAAHDLGANYVRTFGTISVGCAMCIEPSLGTFNDAGFRSLDYALADGKRLGLSFVLTLTDNYQYYTGGKYTFTNWRGVANEGFFTNPMVIADYERYIQKILTHVNQFTGIAYKDDPTIAAWETGNELYVGSTWSRTSFADWTGKISTYLKSQAPKQLVIDGRYGVDDASVLLPNVDIYSNHYRAAADIGPESDNVAKKNKIYMLGEFDWTGKRTTTPLADYLSAIRNSNTNVVSFWSLYGHADSYGYLQHGDGYTLHYPGDTVDMRTRVQQLRQAFYAMRGMSVPPSQVPEAPLLNQPTLTSAGVVLTFRGSATAASYELGRSIDNGATWTVIQAALNENTLPYVDASVKAGTTLYRVRGRNTDGLFGNFSQIQKVTK